MYLKHPESEGAGGDGSQSHRMLAQGRSISGQLIRKPPPLVTCDQGASRIGTGDMCDVLDFTWENQMLHA